MTWQKFSQQVSPVVSVGNLASVFAAKDHEVLLLAGVASAFETMRRRAVHDGLDIVGVSGYRSIDRQKSIWNRKFRAALECGLDDEEALADVLIYSAIPGWSRHHWGSDIDLIGPDLFTTPRLEIADWESGGPCYELGHWLDENAELFGFRKPYDENRGGHLPEPWHWSFVPAALPCLWQLISLGWQQTLAAQELEGREGLYLRGAELFQDYVLGIHESLIPQQQRLRGSTES